MRHWQQSRGTSPVAQLPLSTGQKSLAATNWQGSIACERSDPGQAMSRFHASSFPSAEAFSALSPAHTCCTPCVPPRQQQQRHLQDAAASGMASAFRSGSLVCSIIQSAHSRDCIPRLLWCSSGMIPRRRWPQAGTQPSGCAGRLRWAVGPRCTATAPPGSSCAACRIACGCLHTPAHTA